MSKIKTAVGIVLIIIGIVLLFISSSTIILGILSIILGVGFIIFRKDENIIEEREDLNKRKAK
jgi:type IV secretory pathway VirB3-like protein